MYTYDILSYLVVLNLARGIDLGISAFLYHRRPLFNSAPATYCLKCLIKIIGHMKQNK